MRDKIEHGEIYWVSFVPSIGHEYQGRRPAVVIQSDEALKQSALITVMPLSSQTNKSHKDDILVKKDLKNNLYDDSIIKVHHVESFDYSRFVKKIGDLDDNVINEIKKYLVKHFDL